MPVRATCSNGHTLNLDDKFAGKKVRCPRCGSVIAVPGASSGSRPARPAPAAPRRPVEDDEDFEDDREEKERPLSQEERARERREIKRYEAKKILMGIIFYVSKVDHLVAMPVLLGFFAGGFWLLGNDDATLKKNIFAVTYVFLASLALQGLLGAFFWFFAPKKSGSRGIAISAASAEIVALLALLFMALVAADLTTVENETKRRELSGEVIFTAPTGTLSLELSQLNNLNAVLMTFIVICTLLSVVFFLVAVRGLANFYGDPLLGARSMQILVWILADLLVKALGGSILALLFGWLFQPNTDPVLFVPLLLVAVVGAGGVLALHILIYVKLVMLLYNVRKLVAKKL